VPAAALQALAAKSLLQSLPDDRCALHPLIREFVDEKLQSPQREEVSAAFSRYYATAFGHWAQAIGRGSVTASLNAWRHDHHNLVQAWRLAVAARDGEQIERLNYPLGLFHHWRNWYAAAETIYGEAAAALSEWGEGEPEQAGVYGAVLVRHAWFVYMQGRITPAIALMEAAWPIVERSDDTSLRDMWQRNLVQMVIKAGDFSRAQALVEQMLAGSDPAQHPGAHANRLFNSSHVFAATGDYSRAEQMVGEALEIFEELQDTSRVLLCQYALGNIARAQGNYARRSPCCATAWPTAASWGTVKASPTPRGPSRMRCLGWVNWMKQSSWLRRPARPMRN
jgi:tetratricopeptide (TPR) repeat protein